MSPEARLVGECCRLAADGDLVRRLATGDVDWPHVVALASGDRVLGLVNDGLSRHASGQMPAGIAEDIRRRLFAHASVAILLTKELAGLMRRLDGEGIRALTFKGPALAVAAYGRISLRMFNDIDVLVDEQEYQRCSAFLRGAGYAVLRDFGFEQTLRRAGTPVMVDLHRTISPAAFPVALPFETLWRRRIGVDVGGSRVDTLSTADHLIVLAVQVTRDRWERKGSLAKLCDVARLAADAGIDWPAVLAQASALGFERRLMAVLAAANQLLDAPLPAVVTGQLDQHPRLRRLGSFICRDFLGKADDDLGQLAARIAFHFRVHERPGHKLAQLRMVPIKLREAMHAPS